MEKVKELEENEKIEEKNYLGTEKVSKLVRKFSIPCIISLLVSALYNIVDQIFIGQGVGYVGNAATNIVFPLTVIATAFALLIGDGSSAFLSLCLGRDDKKQAQKGVNNAVIISIILGVLFLVIGWIFQNQLLKLFGVTDSTFEYASQYMKWIILGLPFYMFTTSLNSLIRADGSPKYAMITMLAGAIINLILDPIAIFVFNAGVKGAAIATIVGQIVSAMISLYYLRKFKTIKINKKDLKPEIKILKRIIPLGLSSFITQIAITAVTIVMNNTLSKYGAASKYGSEIPLSALGIVMKVNGIMINIAVGLAAGAQPVIGFNYGAKNYKRVKEALKLVIVFSVGIATVFFLIFQLCPQIIINLFGQENALYNEFAQKCFRIYLMLCILSCAQITISIFFQAIGKPVQSAIQSLSRQIILLIPSIIILSSIFGIEGILWAGPLADGTAFLISTILIIIQLKKIKKLEVESEVTVDG